MMSSRRWRLTGSALIAATGLVGCTGGGGNAPTSSSPTTHVLKGDGTLKLGTMLGRPGNPADPGAPAMTAVALAVADINAAGGVNGTPVLVTDGDVGDGTTPAAIDPVIAAGTDAVIGTGVAPWDASLVTKPVAAGAVVVSPTLTVASMTGVKADKLVFSTATGPSLRVSALTEAVTKDNRATVVVVSSDDPALAAVAAEVNEGLGKAAALTDPISYPAASAQPQATTDLVVAATKVKSAAPDAVVFVGPALTPFARQLGLQGLSPATLPMYAYSDTLPVAGDDTVGVYGGAKAVVAGTDPSEEFKARLLAANPGLVGFSGTPEAYDAAIVVALAAVAAEDDAGAELASTMTEVSSGGTPCASYAECLPLVSAGKDIVYQGLTGPMAFDKTGDRGSAAIAVFSAAEDGSFTPVETLTVKN
jgi:branched-chain amino acid transport system substrate-binding protein